MFVWLLPSALALEPCFDPNELAAAKEIAGDFSASHTTEHVDIAWDPARGDAAEADILAIADALEHAWTVEMDELGWPAPEGTDQYSLQVIVGPFPASRPYAGLTSRRDCDGVTASYLAFNTDFFGQTDMADVAAHELCHASQYATGAFEGNADSQWFFEATATWMQDRVYPASDRYVADFLPGFLQATHAPLDAFGWPPLTEYGHVVFLQYLDQHVAGPELLRDAWTGSANGDNALTVIGAALDDPAMASTFGDFLAHMAAFDLEDGAAMAERDALDVADGAPGFYASTAEALPASGSVDDAEILPQALGASFAHLSFTPEADAGGVRIRFFGAPGESGGDAGWRVGVATRGSAGLTFSSHAAEEGRLTLELGDPTIDAVWLGVGPTTDAAAGLAWSWDAEALEAPEDTGSPEDVDDTGDVPAPACGCVAASPRSLLFLVPALFALARRRPEARC